MLISCAQLVVDTEVARQWISRLVESRLGHRLQAIVEISDLRIKIIAGRIELHGLTIDHPRGRWLALPRALFELDLGNSFLHRGLHFYLVRLERPRFDFRFLSDGTNNILELRPPSGDLRVDFALDRFELHQGEVVFDHERVPLSIATNHVRAQLNGRGSDLDLEGLFLAEGIEIRLPDANPILARVTSRLRARRGRLDVLSGEIRAPGLLASFGGGCQWSEQSDSGEPQCRFPTAGTALGTGLTALGYSTDIAGEFSFDGFASWRPGAAGWRSRVRAQRLDLWDRRVTNFDGTLVGDKFGTRLYIADAEYARGRLVGEVVRTANGPFEVDIQFDQLSLDELLNDQGIQFFRAHSMVDGRLLYTFERSASRAGFGSAEIRLSSQEEGLTTPTLVPLRIRDGIVTTSGATLGATKQSILTSGWYDLERQRGQFEYEIATLDLGELTDFLVFEQRPSWLPTNGRGELNGRVAIRGQSDNPFVNQIELDLASVSNPSINRQRVRGSLRLTEDLIDNLDLTIGGRHQNVKLSGFSGIETQLEAEATRWPITTVEPWLPVELPITGELTGTVTVSRSADQSHPTGTVSGTLKDLAPREHAGAEPRGKGLSGWKIDSTSIAAEWSRDGLSIRRLSLQDDAGIAEVRGFLGSAGQLDLELNSGRIDLARKPFQPLLSAPEVGGEVKLTAQLKGTRSLPSLSMALEIASLTVDHEPISNDPRAAIGLTWSDHRLDFDSQWFGTSTLEGGGPFDGKHLDLAFDFDSTELISEPLGRLIPRIATFGALEESIAGSVRISGVMGHPDSFRADLELDRLEIGLQDFGFRNSAPISASFDGHELVIPSFDLQSRRREGQESARMSGRVGVSSQTLDLKATVRTPLGPLAEILAPSVAVQEIVGDLTAEVKIEGEFGAPEWAGTATISNAGCTFGDLFPHPLADGQGVFRLESGGVSLRSMTASVAGGMIEARGHFPFDRQEPYEVAFDLDDLTIHYPEGWRIKGGGQLQLSSKAGASARLLSGTLELTDIEYLLDIDLGLELMLASFLARQRLQVSPQEGPLADTELAIRLQGENSISIDNNLARLRGSADLDLRGHLAQPLLFGSATLEPPGRLSYNGIDYRLVRGLLSFSDTRRIDPEVDLIATTQRRNFDVDVALQGTLENLTGRFSSNPPLPEIEVLALLAGSTLRDEAWQPREETIGDLRDQSTSAATFLYGQAAGLIGDRVDELFSLDSIRIDPLTGSGDGVSSARVSIGKRLSKDLFLTYSNDPTNTESERFQLEWSLERGFRLVLTQNGDNSYSADLRRESSF